MLALGEARFGAGRRDRCVDDLGMSLRGNHALLHQNRLAHRAVLALGESGFGAGRRDRCVDDLGMVLHRAHSCPRAGLLAAARSVAHALGRLGAIRGAGRVAGVHVDLELVAHRLHGLLLHNHLPADRAVLALGQAGCGAGRSHRSVHSGLVVSANKFAYAAGVVIPVVLTNVFTDRAPTFNEAVRHLRNLYISALTPRLLVRGLRRRPLQRAAIGMKMCGIVHVIAQWAKRSRHAVRALGIVRAPEFTDWAISIVIITVFRIIINLFLTAQTPHFVMRGRNHIPSLLTAGGMDVEVGVGSTARTAQCRRDAGRTLGAIRTRVSTFIANARRVAGVLAHILAGRAFFVSSNRVPSVRHLRAGGAAAIPHLLVGALRLNPAAGCFMLVRVCLGVSADRTLHCRCARRALGDIRARQLADLANAILVAPVVLAHIVAVQALTVAPVVRRLRDLHLAARTPLLLVRGRRRNPLQRAEIFVIVRIQIILSTDRAFCAIPARQTSKIMILLIYQYIHSASIIRASRVDHMTPIVSKNYGT